jgi:hypothetical protein
MNMNVLMIISRSILTGFLWTYRDRKETSEILGPCKFESKFRIVSF